MVVCWELLVLCRAEGGLCAFCFWAEKKKKEELVFLEDCVVELYLEEEGELSFLLLGEGSRGIIQS